MRFNRANPTKHYQNRTVLSKSDPLIRNHTIILTTTLTVKSATKAVPKLETVSMDIISLSLIPIINQTTVTNQTTRKVAIITTLGLARI